MKAKLTAAERTRLSRLITDALTSRAELHRASAFGDDEELASAGRSNHEAETALYEALYYDLEVTPAKKHRRED